MLNEMMKAKIRSKIKALARSPRKYNISEAHMLIREKIKQEEALLEEEMPEISNDIWSRLQENWAKKS